MYNDRFARAAPVNEGDELNVKIEALGEKGDGIAKKNGFVLVVPGTQVNDEVKIRVTKVLRKVGFAEVIGKADGPVETTAGTAVPHTEKPKKPHKEESEEETQEEEMASPEEESGEFSENFGEEEQQ